MAPSIARVTAERDALKELCGEIEDAKNAQIAHMQKANKELWADKSRAEAALREAREVLQTIADFAVGNGDVCEIIARRARAALKAEDHA